MSESDIDFIKNALIRIESRLFNDDGMCNTHDRAISRMEEKVESVKFLWVVVGGEIIALMAIIAGMFIK